MRRTTPLTAAALLGLALLSPATTATAAGETCRGEAATIVGTGSSLTGTEGRDVIVTGTALEVVGLGGDDLVCATGIGTVDLMSIDAGSGNDLVDSTALSGSSYVDVDLGVGADIFAGGASNDTVTTGAAGDGYQGIDDEADTVGTGSGDDRVVLGSWQRSTADAVDLGPGDDTVTWSRFSTDPTSSIVGGDGRDRLSLLLVADGTAEVDLSAGLVRETFRQGATYTGRFSSFEAADVETASTGSGAPVVGSIDVRGTSGDDELVVRSDDSFGPSRLSVDMLGGDDTVLVKGLALLPASGLDLGRGDDDLVVTSAQGRLELDLAQDVLRAEGGTYHDTVAVAAGVENAFLLAPRVTMVGDHRDNRLVVNGCTAVLRGGRGDDLLTTVSRDARWEEYELDCTVSATMSGGQGKDRLRGGAGKDKLRGGAGNDRLQGRGGKDVLLGGRGQDLTDGGKARDRCVAERERRCER